MIYVCLFFEIGEVFDGGCIIVVYEEEVSVMFFCGLLYFCKEILVV